MGVCKELYNKFNWGKNYELLVETCEEIDQCMMKLVNFQLTRFANSVRFVVITLRLDYEAVICCLLKIHESCKHSSNMKDQDKSRDALRLLKLIQNKKFCLHLSGTADIYDAFGHFVNEVQQVNILPHERYDNALMVLDQMVVMKEQMSHSTCLKTKHCAWPRYHEDENKLFEAGMYRNVKIEKDKDSRMYQTRMSTISDEVEIQTDSLEQVKDNLRILVYRLEEDLRHDVFPEKTVELIERIRFVTVLQTVAKEISSKGGILVGSLRAQEFLLNIRISSFQKIFLPFDFSYTPAEYRNSMGTAITTKIAISMITSSPR